MVAFVWNNFVTIFFMLILVTLAIVYIGERLVFYAEKLAVGIGISGGLVGYILVAAVTSIPEVVSTFIAASDGLPSMASGNIFGSNAANVALLAMIVIGASAKLTRLSWESWSGITASLLMVAVVTIIYLMAFRGTYMPSKLSFALWPLIIYIGLMYLNFTLIKKEGLLPKEEGQGGVAGFSLFSLLIVGCSWLLVTLCTRMTELPFPGLGKPLGEQFVGTLVLAVSTSVPELVTTNSMVRRGLTDMAYGNIFGSNVFNLMIFCWAPMFAATSAGVFLQSIPITLIYTVLAIILFSTMMALATLMSSKKAQMATMVGIVVLWAGSLALVF